MGWFISAVIVSVLCCLGTAGCAYDLYEDIRYGWRREKRRILKDLMWVGYYALCTAATFYMAYALWVTRAIW